MRYEKFFELAKEAGIEQCELVVRSTYSLSFSIFHSEIDSYESNNGLSIVARGLVKGKFGLATCDVWNLDKAKFLVKEIVANAKIIEDDDPMFIFEGSKKYKRVNTFNNELATVPTEKKIEDALKLEKLVKEGDPRISEVAEVGYSEKETTLILMNSLGLKLKRKSNNFFTYAQAVAKEKEQTKSNFDFILENDYSKYDVRKLAKKVVDNTVGQLGGYPCESGSYPVVLDKNVVSALIGPYISSASAEEVQKHTSLFIDKIDTKVASSKVTIEDRPLDKTLFAASFDDEGVATFNKPIIKNGVLKTYLHNLTTAAKAGCESTGNAEAGAKMGISPIYMVMKPGKNSFDDLLKEANNGVLVTDVSGLHAGLDARTGNFSLQSSGFLIKDGKKDHPLDIITVSGNLLDLFKNIITVGNDNENFSNAINCPSVLVKKLMIGGK